MPPEAFNSKKTVETGPLGRNWRRDEGATRRAGDEWLGSRETALLKTPSAIVPATWNVLINPQRPESVQVRLAGVHRHSIDPRLAR
jgi:RES domain-containing protein